MNNTARNRGKYKYQVGHIAVAMVTHTHKYTIACHHGFLQVNTVGKHASASSSVDKQGSCITTKQPGDKKKASLRGGCAMLIELHCRHHTVEDTVRLAAFDVGDQDGPLCSDHMMCDTKHTAPVIEQ